MVNPSFNSIYESNERIELTLSALIVNIKRIEEKFDRLTSLSERNADSQNVINTTAAPPQREPVFLDEATYSCLRSPLQRDLQKPFLTVTTRDRKETRIRTISNQLNNYTKTAVSLLIQKLDEMNVAEESRSWKNVPDHLKHKCYQDIELIAKKAKLDLDRCIDSWGAKVLAANHYPNATRKSKDTLLSSPCVGPSTAAVAVVDDDEIFLFGGSDDEEDDLSDQYELDIDAAEEVAGERLVTNKKKGKQPSNNLKRKR
ncbi:hypothetical protein BD770DRAFT_384780 [Pilaira anomala]|nr:hypothetical protein BD770DRAFT_384780 [Pilaira anomala]